MKQSKDPFEAAFEESPPESPNHSEEFEPQTTAAAAAAAGGAGAASSHQNPTLLPREEEDEEEEQEDYDGDYDDEFSKKGNISGSGNGSGVAPAAASALSISASTSAAAAAASAQTKPKTAKDDFDEEDDDNMDVELSKFPSSADPDKMAKMQSILSRFTEHQMSRYESFRRSALQKANMKRLLASITGTQKISLPMTIVVCGIAKMFVGELVETARVVMTERKESGPIRPCHIREAYRRLKLEGKVPKRSVPRLFR